MSNKKQNLFEKTRRYIKTKEGKVYDEELAYFKEDRYHVIYTKRLFTNESISANTIVEDRTYVPASTVFFRILQRLNVIPLLMLTSICYFTALNLQLIN